VVSPIDTLADAEVADRCLSGILSLRGVDLADGPGEGIVMVSVGTQATNYTARYVSASVLLRDMRMEDLLGKELDPNFHEALATMPNEKYAEGQICNIVKTGWMLGDKLLRAAQVVVSAGTGAKPEEA
jgi:molecular chaperone GrpE